MSTQKWSMRVREYMKQYQMAETGDGILAAVSGGADSVCLLLLLKEFSETMGIHLAAFHLNHGLRGAEADRDEKYVRDLCETLDVPLAVVHENVAQYAREHGLSEEEAGRTLRYSHLDRVAKELNFNKIATAHHKDDDVETVLMNLFRGSGLRGLGGIQPVRGNIIRPLLCLTRDEIEEYLNKKGITWCEDSTNRELVYARNKVRNALVPWLKENVNLQVGEHILKTAALAAQADEYFALQVEMILREDRTRISTAVFDAQPDIMKTYLVRRMIAEAAGSEKDISARHIEAVCELNGPGGGTEINLPYGLKAVRGYEFLEIRHVESGSFMAENSNISVHTQVFPWKKETEIPKNQYTKWFDYDKIKGTLTVRFRESGDFITIGDGKTKKLKRFFIDEKVPEEIRDKIPLVADGNHILWIVGYRISDYYKLSDTTRTVLEVRVDKGESNV